MSAQDSDSNDQPPEPTPAPASNLGATLLRVAWLAIILGLVRSYCSFSRAPSEAV